MVSVVSVGVVDMERCKTLLTNGQAENMLIGEINALGVG